MQQIIIIMRTSFRHLPIAITIATAAQMKTEPSHAGVKNHRKPRKIYDMADLIALSWIALSAASPGRVMTGNQKLISRQ
jgi:hypothetical protein